MKPVLPVTVCFFVLVAGASSCRERDHERTRYGDGAATATLTAASWYPTDSAIDRIVTARCEHLFTCHEVGPDARYQTPDACVLEHRRAVRSAMSNGDCEDGVDGKALDACIGAIKQNACGRPRAAAVQAPECQTRELCVRH
jgi:hypothetical protein